MEAKSPQMLCFLESLGVKASKPRSLTGFTVIGVLIYSPERVRHEGEFYFHHE